jgi:hypothetical protein
VSRGVVKWSAANRKRQLSALPNVGPYTRLKFLVLQGAPYLYDISRLKVKRPACVATLLPSNVRNWKCV